MRTFRHSGRLLSLLLLLLPVYSISLSQAQEKQVPLVEIFYETLTAAGRKFFVEQFKRLPETLLETRGIDLRLYPYGRTTKQEDGDGYVCPIGGAPQCEANKIHACLINAELDAPATENPVHAWLASATNDITASPINARPVAQFINCFAKNRFAKDNVEELGAGCVPADGAADWAFIRECILDPGTDATLTDSLATITTEIEPEILQEDGLVIRIDGSINAAAKTNLLREICAALQSTEDFCAQPDFPPKVKLAVYYEAFNRDANDYFSRQLAVYYHVLEDFVDIDLIPYGNTLYNPDTQAYSCSDSSDSDCFSNKFQALVVDTYIGKHNRPGDPISGENRAVNFLKCLSLSTIGNVFDSLEACSNQALEPDDYHTFLEYIRMDGAEIRDVFEAARTKTEAVQGSGSGLLERIPLVTINGDVSYAAFEDLVQEACAQYTGVSKASICTKVKLEILYEPLNHKSRTFFLEQLRPVFTNLYSLIDLQLNPAGRAELIPGAGFSCKGGASQCTAMILQACTLDYFWNNGHNYTDPIRLEVFDFIVCTLKNRRMLNVMDAAELCSEEHLEELDAWFTIHGCLSDGNGIAILAEYIEEAQSTIEDIGHHDIPILRLNGTEVEDLSHLRRLVCDFYDDYHAPDYCFTDQAPKVQIQVYYESMHELARQFFTTQFGAWYMYVEEMAEFDLLPVGNVREINNPDDGSCDSYEPNSACFANKIQAIILDKYSRHDDDGDEIDGRLRVARFLSCYFGHASYRTNIFEAGEYCVEATLLEDEWFDLLVTAHAPEGAAIYKEFVDTTKQFLANNSLESFSNIPWLTLSEQHHSKRAQFDLLQTICGEYRGDDRPPECTPVHVQLYYSGINPASRRFFLEQFIPTFRNLRERLDVELIAYGVANPDSSLEQECQAKAKICEANRIQACAIEALSREDVIDEELIQWDGKNQTLDYIACMFKNIQNLDLFSLAEECGAKNGIQPIADDIIQCSQQPHGDELLRDMRSKTLGQYETMTHAPWIVINGRRSALAETDLKQAICDALTGDKPAYCYETTPEKVRIDFHYSTLSSDVQRYFTEELYPHYRALEEIIDLDVIPFGLMEILKIGEEGATVADYLLICPGGVQECRTNLIHACIYAEHYNVADHNPDDEREYDSKLLVIEYIQCYFTSPSYPTKPVDAATACIEIIFGDDTSVHTCAQSLEGIEHLLTFQAKVDALLPHLTYIPWITLNRRHSYTLEHHFRRTACDAYQGREKPADCYQIDATDSKPSVWIHYEIADSSSAPFFTTVLDPELSPALSELRLIPFGRSTYNESAQSCINDPACAQYKEHACILELFYSEHPAEVLRVIGCTFEAGHNGANVVNECADQHLEDVIPDPWRPIEACVQDRGDALLLSFAALVQDLAPRISHVPWILINGEHSLEAETDFLNELCYVYYPADKPAACLPALIPVGVYYETANSDVDAFFLGQLAQYSEYLDEIGDFSFIPYGTTSQNNQGEFVCTGENQCPANIAHACILNRFYHPSAQNPESESALNRIRVAKFLECTAFPTGAVATDPVLRAEECLDINFEGDLWGDIHFCFSGTEGQGLYAEMGRQTQALTNPTLTSAPYVTIAGEYSEEALVDLFRVLCNTYKLVKAPLCSTLPSLAVRVGIYFGGNYEAQDLFQTQLAPFYQEIIPILKNEAELHSIIAPDLIAWGNTSYDATSNPTDPFTCSGENECYINRVFACIEHYHGDEKRYDLHKMEFALCFFGQPTAILNPAAAINMCTNRVWIPDPFVQLNECALSTEQDAIDIFLKARDKTENNYPHLVTFPAITINNEQNPDALANLLRIVCLNYKGYDVPLECEAFLDATTTESPSSSEPTETPTNGTTLPPTDETTGPSTNGTTLPPTDETTGPSTNGTTLPPTDETTDPSTNGTNHTHNSAHHAHNSANHAHNSANHAHNSAHHAHNSANHAHNSTHHTHNSANHARVNDDNGRARLGNSAINIDVHFDHFTSFWPFVNL